MLYAEWLDYVFTILTQKSRTELSWQSVDSDQTAPEEQSDQCLHCLPSAPKTFPGSISGFAEIRKMERSFIAMEGCSKNGEYTVLFDGN